jgi:hypothetical protein
MDLDGNGKLDWFFNEYVYGTELPNYRVDSSFSQTDEGVKMKLKITQSNVDDQFKMLVPVYLELSDGRIARLGSGTLIGNSSVEKELLLGKLKEPPKRALVNYYYDVLSTGN